MNKRRDTLLLLAGSALLRTPSLAFAQAFPNRSIRIIVAYPPGGQADSVARVTAQKLGELLDGSVVVENRPGANSTLGAESVARAPADGYTLLMGGAANLTIAPALDSQLRYDTMRDFAPIGRIARVPQVLAVRAGLPITTVAQLVDYAKRNPGKLTFASPAASNELAIESLKTAAGLAIVVVPYKGTAPAMLDLIAGRVDLTFTDVASVSPHVRSGTMRVIANAGAVRAREYRDIPTLSEQGIASFVWESWQGLVAPRGTPPEIIARLQSALRQALAAAEFRDSLERLGFVPIDESPDTFPRILQAEIARHRDIVRRIGKAIE